MKILFAAYGGGHIKSLLPVVEKLRLEGHIECIVLALTSAAAECRSRGIPCMTMRDFEHLYTEEAIEMGRKLADALPNRTVDRDESAAYLGISFYELCQSLGFEEADKVYRKSGRSIFCPVQAMQVLLMHVKPDVVVTTNSPRSERALMIAAHALSIPSLCVIDFPDTQMPYLTKPGYGSRLCVLDDFARNQLVEGGRNPGDVAVTGNPAFDHYGSPKAQVEAGAYRKAHLKGGKLVAYASNVEPGSNHAEPLQQKVLSFLHEQCAQLGYTLSYRQHPSEVRHLPPAGALDGNAVPLETFLTSADLVVTFPSTIAIETKILHVPTVVLGMSKLLADMAILSNGQFTIVHNFAGLGQHLHRIPERANRKPVGQQAADRVIGLIREVVSTS